MAALSRMLADPSCLLHGVDAANGRLIFLPTSQDRIRDVAFIDGRTDFSSAPPLSAPIADALASAPLRRRGVERYIFHVSFCGSTLLARLLEGPDSVVLKEPNCLVDLADFKVGRRSGDRLFGRVLKFARAMLSRPWKADEPVVIKPSSWANTLLRDILADRSKVLPVFVTMRREQFVRAVLRGGRDRLAFASRLAVAMASVVQGGDMLVHAAIQSSTGSLSAAVNLAIVAQHLQLTLFRECLERGGWGRDHVIDFSEIESSPLNAAQRANEILQLHLPEETLQRSVQSQLSLHSKNGRQAFSPEQRRRENELVDAHHGALIAESLHWADIAVGLEIDLRALPG